MDLGKNLIIFIIFYAFITFTVTDHLIISYFCYEPYLNSRFVAFAVDFFFENIVVNFRGIVIPQWYARRQEKNTQNTTNDTNWKLLLYLACKSVVIFMLISQMGFMVSIFCYSLGFWFHSFSYATQFNPNCLLGGVNVHGTQNNVRICWPSQEKLKPKPFLSSLLLVFPSNPKLPSYYSPLARYYLWIHIYRNIKPFCGRRPIATVLFSRALLSKSSLLEKHTFPLTWH